MGRRLKDYVTVWNASTGVIYMVVGTVAGLVGLKSLGLHGDFANMANIVKTRFTGLGANEIVTIVFFFLMWLTGVMNFVYARRPILAYKTKSFLSFVSPFLLILMHAAVAVLIFFDVRISNSGLDVIYRAEFIGSLDWIGWTVIGIVGLCFALGIAGIVIMINGAFASLTIMESNIIKEERQKKEKERKKEKEKEKKRKEKERNKNKSDYIMPTQARASREKIDESEMMFKSGDTSEEDEKLAEEIASHRKNPFLQEEEKKEEGKEEKKAEPTVNANGVSMDVVNENPLLNGPVIPIDQAMSPNISANAEPDEPEPEPEPEEKKEPIQETPEGVIQSGIDLS